MMGTLSLDHPPTAMRWVARRLPHFLILKRAIAGSGSTGDTSDISSRRSPESTLHGAMRAMFSGFENAGYGRIMTSSFPVAMRTRSTGYLRTAGGRKAAPRVTGMTVDQTRAGGRRATSGDSPLIPALAHAAARKPRKTTGNRSSLPERRPSWRLTAISIWRRMSPRRLGPPPNGFATDRNGPRH